MANKKKKNNIQITSVKSDNEVLKEGVDTVVVNKKTRQNNKKNNGLNNNKKSPQKKQNTNKKNNNKNYNKKTNKTPKKVIEQVSLDTINKEEEEVQEEQIIIKDTLGIETPEIEIVPKVLTPEEIIAKRKERNRKKYEKGQKKYREKEEKKKIFVPDVVEEKEEVKEEIKVVEDIEDTLVKKIVPVVDYKQIKEQERKEKRKTNRKTSGFTQTLTNLKELSVSKINDVREITSDNTIPLGKTIPEQNKRSKRLIKEAIVYAVILTIINVICILVFDYFNFLRLFDVKWLNVVITILISLIFNFFVAFMIDYFVTNVWVKKRRKKDGGQDGDSWVNRKERRKDIKDKEGK